LLGDVQVFLDVNRNFAHDASVDPHTRTSSRGAFNLLTPDRLDGTPLGLAAAGSRACVDAFTAMTPKLVLVAPSALRSNQSLVLSPLSTLTFAMGMLETMEAAPLLPEAADLVRGLLNLTASPVDGKPVNVLALDAVREVMLAEQLGKPSSGAFVVRRSPLTSLPLPPPPTTVFVPLTEFSSGTGRAYK
jgi:hypothetical protein